MTIANDIINGHIPDFQFYLNSGASLDDIDEYGFTPLIECAITGHLHIAEKLLQHGVDVNKADVTGSTPLHWAVDNNNPELTRFLLERQANPNAYTLAGLSVLVYPLLRSQENLKQLLYAHGAKLDFAQDFINAKFLGHRFELTGYVDILNSKGEFIEVNYEGFILEFTVAVILDSIRRFMNSYVTRHLSNLFPFLYQIMDAFNVANALLKLQNVPVLQEQHKHQLSKLLQAPLLILPAASRGHAMCFLKMHNLWAKIDRGANSLKEGSVNIYNITIPEAFNANFVLNFLYKRQDRNYFHKTINQQLGLKCIAQLPISRQIVGNCSWADVQASVAVGYVLQELSQSQSFVFENAMKLYNEWIEWDRDRALDECIRRFYLADPPHKASLAAMLGAVLFQACDHAVSTHIVRAEKILAILVKPEYYYILHSYLNTYCVKRLTRYGNNLLKLLDDCGVNPHIGVTP